MRDEKNAFFKIIVELVLNMKIQWDEGLEKGKVVRKSELLAISSAIVGVC